MEYCRRRLKDASKRKPLIGAHVANPEIPEYMEPTVVEAAQYLRGFSFRELEKFKNSISNYDLLIRKSLMRTVAGLKALCSMYPHMTSICVYIFKHHTSIKGIDEYEDFPRRYSLMFDAGRTQPGPEMWDDPLFIRLRKAHHKIGGKLTKAVTRQLPPLSCLPTYNRSKESKMWLTELDCPPLHIREKFKENFRKFIRRYSPNEITEPPYEATVSYGNSWYADDYLKKKDSEKPELSYHGRFHYQWFWTSPASKREVWLPSKQYKRNSLYWHLIAAQIIDKVPWCVGNNTLTDVRKRMFSKWKPSRKIDLKGFGMQFPREYLLSMMEVIEEFYGPFNDNAREEADYLFNNLSIIMEDGKTIYPKRGCGLGYYNHLMTLGVASILQDLDVTMMFSDDILINHERYDEALKELQYYGFVINWKKTGDLFKQKAYFAGVCMTKPGSLHFGDVNAPLCAGFTSSHHHERKGILLSCPIVAKYIPDGELKPVPILVPRRLSIAYSYRRLFGYETHALDIMEHPTKWGILPYAPKSVGYVKGGLLRKYITDRQDGPLSYLMYSRWRKTKSREFASVRYNARKLKNVFWSTDLEEYLHPEVEDNLDEPMFKSGLDAVLRNYPFPTWADYQNLVVRQETVGRVTHGLPPSRAAKFLRENLLSRDPIGSGIYGGTRVLTGFSRIPGLNNETMIIYLSLLACRYVEPDRLLKKPERQPISGITEDEIKSMLEKTNMEEGPITAKDLGLTLDPEREEIEDVPPDEWDGEAILGQEDIDLESLDQDDHPDLYNSEDDNVSSFEF
jgi:hypothetical protein